MTEAAVADKPQIVTPKKAEDFRLAAHRFHFQDPAHKRNWHVVDVENNCDPKDLLNPPFWAFVAYKMNPFDLVEVRRDDGAFWALLLVLGSDRTWARVETLVLKHIAKPDAAQVQKDQMAGYKYEWKGPRLMHCIVRISDGEIVHQQAASKADAMHWFNEHKEQIGK